MFNFNLNEEDEELDENPTKEDQEQSQIPKEPMFEKPLTPSDVGKLNRLVIPKQHAEKFFPLSGAESGGEKGLLLSFEDELGKTWKFRYSYWNSSQSYVLTKGWSRFVKEKRLDAGDIVLFMRHQLERNRIFIGWRRRNVATARVQDSGVAQVGMVVGGGSGGGGGGLTHQVVYCGNPYPCSGPNWPPLPYQTDSLQEGLAIQNQKTPSGNSKRLRLFGVNLECQADDSEPPTPDSSSMSIQGQSHYLYHNPKTHVPNDPHNHKQDINFSGDGDQMRYLQG